MTVRTRVEIDELALPAVCGQTGKPFLIVVRRRGPGLLELIRAVVIEDAPSVSSVAIRPSDPPPRTHTRVPSPVSLSNGTGGGIPEDPDISFQALTMSVRINIGNLYDGCPYCRARGYFHCARGDCGMFSCWTRHNKKPHFDHTDVWCAACQSWRCTSDDDSLSELKAYAARENGLTPRSRIALGSTTRDQINCSTPIKGYLK